MKIYVDNKLDDYSDSLNSSGQGQQGSAQWATYQFKPKCQETWEEMVSAASMEITGQSNKPHPPNKSDRRPHLFDKKSGKWVLLDSGAMCSLWPKSDFPEAKVDPTRILQAVNGTTLPTYGTKKVTLTTQGRTFEHSFVISETKVPLVGWDFLQLFQLDITWQKKKCFFMGQKGQQKDPIANSTGNQRNNCGHKRHI